MIANWLKVLLFAAGGMSAAAATVYYTGIYDPWTTRTVTPQVASAPETARPSGAGTQGDEPDVPEQEASAEAPEAPQPQEPQAAALPQDDEPETTTGEGESLAIPSFHVVRVEPDGSMVIAGSAEPNSQIEVVAGAQVIARADVGAAGDFAAVLDDALDPGDYQIVLRSTGPAEGSVTTSVETAIVSVPEDASGQVLALVEEPGEASRLITLPEAVSIVEEDAAGEDSAGDVADTGLPQEDDSQVAARADASAQKQEEDDVAGNDAGAPESEEDATGGEAVVASADPQPEAETSVRPGTPRSALAVEAIEIEGGSVFVAGRGTAGTTVRVYANDILLGEARVSEAGRFLIETQADLPVGDYIVRTDVIGPGGVVTARAAVPFQREPGETVAAVAPADREETAEMPQAQAQAGQAEAVAEPEAGPDAQAEAEPAPARAADGQAIASSETASAASSEPAEAAGIEETMSPGLQSVDGSVIIRRGDTLWHISRRVYGRGVRYSTIYLANQDQIRDPDLIWPGQIFSVPDETEEGERADMNAVSDQIAPRTSVE
jgi:nucleoid-associated protein YgaU